MSAAHVVDEGMPRDFHVGFVTDDIAASTAFLAGLLGLEAPAVGLTPAPEIACTVVDGLPSPQRNAQTYLQWDERIAFEFLTPDDNPGALRDWLDRHGPGVHHLGFAVRDLDATGDAFTARGLYDLQSGGWDGGRYSYRNTEHQLGVIVELLQYDRYRGL
jgi:methylmalonyl-CoA/ethylmalonyl-CoA epimerase